MNGYIQKTIGGEERGLKFNQMALTLFIENTDFDKYEATSNYAMVYAGLAACSYVKTKEAVIFKTEMKEDKPVLVPVTFEEVCDWVDEMEDKDLNDITQTFISTTVWKKAQDKAKQSWDKKKLENSTEQV